MRRNAQLVAQTGCVVLHVDVHTELLGCIEQNNATKSFPGWLCNGRPAFLAPREGELRRSISLLYLSEN